MIHLIAALACAPAPWVSAQESNRPAEVALFKDKIRPVLVAHCYSCHSEKAEKLKGDLRLDRLSPDFADGAGRKSWLAVLDRVQAGEMPPKPKPRLPEHDVRALTDWIRGRLEKADAARRAAQGRAVLRRLNRTEYTNTVRDLLGVEVDLRELLALDGSMDGFDNVGVALHLSSFAMERYLEASNAALDAAIANRPAPPRIKERYSLKDQHAIAIYGEDYYRVLGDTVVCFDSSSWNRVGIGQFYPSDGGTYRFRISASGFQSAGKPVTFEVSNGTTGLVGYFDVPADKPTVIEFVARVERQTSISILPYGLGSLPSDEIPGKAGHAAQYKGPGLAVHWVEAEGPLTDAWPPASHRRIFGDLAQSPVTDNSDRLEVVSQNPLSDALLILRSFVRRAFRRTVNDDDLKPFVALVKSRLEEKDSFEQAVRVALSGVMSSPEFLFLDEKPGKLDDFALACRLSYFLWSTMPDDELFALAEQKKLGNPDTLRKQVERMLGSPKAAAFATNFIGQWLRLRDIDLTAPNTYTYPEFDEMLKVSMVRETELFFAELLKNDQSLANFVASDFSMLNGRLAKHYGIPGVEGWEFRKVPLPPTSHRGGVLTMASVLKVTADGTSTSPVKRGIWVLERILGTPPAKPPADIPALEPDTRGATTLREQLAKHRNNVTCAACHAKIDPPGFALESFDVIGGWRNYYRLSQWTADAREVKGQIYLEGATVDPVGEMADGRRFQNIDEFKQLLLKDKDQLARSLAQKLMTYATGGAPESADRPEIEAIVARIRGKNYGLRSLVHEIVQSRLFHYK